MTASTPRRRRLLSLAAATGIATVGMVGLSSTAHAADANSKVWVCKYVRTPGGNEVLKAGKNPIEVSGHSVDKDKDGQVFVGDQFVDGQERSVIVQIEGSDPGPGICAPVPPVTPENPDTPGGTPGTPGTGAPGTGGEGSGMPLGLLGGGVLMTGAALLAAAAQRRRRGTAGS